MTGRLCSKTTLLVLMMTFFAVLTGAQTVTTYQTGFDLTNDASGSNYTTGSIIGQNLWDSTNSTYGQGEICDSSSIPHQGDGYLQVHGVAGKGIFHDSGITRSLPPGGAVKITFRIGTPEPSGSDHRIELRSSVIGLLFRVGKYAGGSSSISYAADACEIKFTGYDTSTSTWRNNSNWAAYHDGRQTIVEITVTRNGIDYHLQETWALPDPNTYGWVSEVWHHSDFATPLDDVRDFGDIQFIGATSGVWTDAYIDELKVEYLVNPQVTWQTGFNQTNDSSGCNYTTGSIIGQNDWDTTSSTYGLGYIYNDTGVPHQGDGYLQVHGVVSKGVFHAAGIDPSLPPGGKIKISFKIGTPEPSGSDRRIEVNSSEIGLLFRVGKYEGASSSLSYAADANETKFTGYDTSTSTWRNDSNWAAYHDGRQTIVEITITRGGIDYHLQETWALPDPNTYGWVSEVWHSCDFATPLDDIRDFGNIQFIGASTGVWTDAYIDDLKIEYLVDWIDASSYSTLNEALTAAVSAGKNGIWIPAGHTANATTMSLPNNFAIVGENASTSKVSFTAMTNYDGFKASSASPENIEFRNFTVESDNITPPSGVEYNSSGVIKISNSSRLKVSEVKFYDSPRHAICCGGNEMVIENSHFERGNFLGINISGTDNVVTCNTLTDSTWYGIQVAGSNCHVTYNTLSEFAGTNAFGIKFSSLNNSVISNNTISNIQKYGIYGSSANCHDNAILDNTIAEIGIVGGVAVNGAGTGINLWPGAHDNLLMGNQVSSCLGYGIIVAGDTQTDTPDNSICENTVSSSADPGIITSGASGTLLRKNSSNNCSSTGFTIGSDLAGVNSDGAKVFHNEAIGNMCEGIDVNAVSGGYFYGNYTEGNSSRDYTGHDRCGFRLNSSGANSNLVYCNVSITDGSNQNYGIILNNGAYSNLVKYNDLYQNLVGALQDLSGASNTISDNRDTSSTTPLDSAPPVADAGSGAVVASGQQGITLDGTGSYFMNGTGSMSYSWQQIYGTTVTLSNATSAQAGFTAPTVTSVQLLGFRLTVSSANGSTFDEVYLVVMP